MTDNNGNTHPFSEAMAIGGLASSSPHMDVVLLRMKFLYLGAFFQGSGAHVPGLLAGAAFCLQLRVIKIATTDTTCSFGALGEFFLFTW